jgi:hypothetical protein
MDTPKMGGAAMLALVEGNPNTAIMIFDLLASAIFALAIHRYHQTLTELPPRC